MVSVLLILVGLLLMVGGVLMLGGWLSGKSKWFDSGVYDKEGASKNDRQFLDLYFIALIIAPLLVGALLIVFGLRGMQ